MAEDNNRSDKQTSRKDAKREAKIEAKRRKLAEQRAAKENAEKERILPPMRDTESERPVERPAPADSGIQNEDSDRSRTVTADTNNRERRILFEKYESGDVPETVEPPSSEQPEEEASGIGNTEAQPAPAGKKKAGVVASEAAAGFFGACWRQIKRFFKWLFHKIVNGFKNMTPQTALRLLLALAVLSGIIYGALEFADREDKKTDVYVTDKGFHHAAGFDSCVPLNGIDVSVHQKGEIDWKKLKSSGVDFVFVRAGYRAADNGSLHADESFERNIKAAQKAGLMTGVYFFSQALTPEEGKEEAEFVLDIIKDYEITMPVAIDYEIYKDGRLDKKIQAGELYAASLYHDIVLGFTERIEKAGYESVVYASRDMLTNYMQADLLDDMATIWLARYDNVANLDADYWFWQYTEEGKAGGIEEDVDLSFWYMEPNKVYPTRGKRSKRSVSVGDCRISFKRSSFKLHNFRAEPKYGITYEGKGMKEGRDYVSSVVHNTRSGTGYLIIRGIGKYKDWIMYPFTIE